MIDRGATTIWETWKESDNIYSNCHPMFGSVSEWFYRWLGGIRPDQDFPGFKKFIISPSLPDGIAFVNCSYKSPFGIIQSNWEKSKIGVKFEIAVPKTTTALFKIPVSKNAVIVIEDLKNNKVTRSKVEETTFISELTEGNYRIKY
jgi:alpha-L-rhamnosidase